MSPVKHVWLRNLLFGGLCLAGITAVSGSLLNRDRVPPPQASDASLPQQDDFRQTVAKIDQQFRDHWQAKNLPHAKRADDLAIARRLALGLCGTVPSLEEIRAFEQHPADDRVQWFVSHLLEDRRSADYLAERFARAYVGTENGPFILYRRRRFVMWLSDHLHENVGYDQIVREVIADTGLGTSSPAVNFVTVTLDENSGNQPNEIRLAARTTRAFLGMRIDCLQCHDDKLDKFSFPDGKGNSRAGEQSDFHRLAAFYGETKQSATGVRDTNDEPYKYQYLNAKDATLVPPEPPFHPELVPSTGTRREQLARWVTHRENKMFARATVNRVWALMFGNPLIEPIDDLPLDAKYYPPGLETLSDDFIAHDYNLRRLVRLIAATEVFQLDSRAEFEITPEYESRWAVFPLARLRPEQVAGSLIQSASLSTIDADASIISQLTKFGQTNGFVERYGDAGDDEFTQRGGTIMQRLLLMNGELSKDRTKEDPVMNASTRLAMLADDNAAIEAAYLTILTRRPTATEKDAFLTALGDKKTSRNETLEDLYWVLLNSTEFSWNH